MVDDKVVVQDKNMVQELPEGIIELLDACTCGCGLWQGAGGG